MLTTRSVVIIFSTGLMVLGAGMVLSQDYPNKVIRIITSGAGGSADFAPRLIAQGVSVPLGQQVIVENRPGIIAMETVAKAPPDGYSLLATGSAFWIGPLIQNLPYDPVRDFSPITLVASSPAVLVVHPSLPVKSVKELIALAKARPGELNFAMGGIGGVTQIAPELLKSMTGVNMVGISYKGAGPASSAVVSGEVQLMFANAGAVTQLIKSGKLKALAVTSAQPSMLLPNLPTIAASAGLPGYEAESRTGIFAPAKTPGAIITRLNQEIVRLLNTPEVKERFLTSGVEAVSSSPEQLAAVIKSEISRLRKVIKDAGIRTE